MRREIAERNGGPPSSGTHAASNARPSAGKPSGSARASGRTLHAVADGDARKFSERHDRYAPAFDRSDFAAECDTGRRRDRHAVADASARKRCDERFAVRANDVAGATREDLRSGGSSRALLRYARDRLCAREARSEIQMRRPQLRRRDRPHRARHRLVPVTTSRMPRDRPGATTSPIGSASAKVASARAASAARSRRREGEFAPENVVREQREQVGTRAFECFERGHAHEREFLREIRTCEIEHRPLNRRRRRKYFTRVRNRWYFP